MRVCDLAQVGGLFLIIVASAISAQSRGNELFAETIAQVNGDVITTSEYEQERRLLEKRLQRRFTGSELEEAICITTEGTAADAD